MKSWKIGAVAGLIAGIVLGISYGILSEITISMGLWEPWWRPVQTGNTIINIPLFGFWGIVLGIIYSKTYGVIPKKGVLKGLIYGLILYFIIAFRMETYNISYGRFLTVVGHNFTGFFSFLSFGLVLGILYELLRSRYRLTEEKLRVKEYDMRSGIIPGAIAGLCGGTAASIISILGPATGLWGFGEGPVTLSLDLWFGQAGAHMLWNMLWGTVFGAMFAKVYNLVPGKKFKKGLYFGLVMFLITTFQIGTWCVIATLYHNDWFLTKNIVGNTFCVGGANAIVFAIVLGLLYRKPVEAITIKEKPVKEICKHCGFKIDRDSIFCKKCGKKQ